MLGVRWSCEVKSKVEEKEREKEDVDPRAGSYLSWFTGAEAGSASIVRLFVITDIDIITYIIYIHKKREYIVMKQAGRGSASWLVEVTAEEKEAEGSGSYLGWCAGDEDSDSRSASYLSWFTGEEVPTGPPTKSELYVKKLVGLKRVLQEWRHRTLETREAGGHILIYLVFSAAL